MHSLMRKSRLFLDTNILMDFLFDRDIQKDSTNAIIQMGIDGVFENCISILSLVTVAYVARKYMDNCRIEPVLKECSDMFTVLPSDNTQHLLALSYNGNDYEDKLQMACAKESGCRYIITRNVNDFSGTPQVPVYTPNEFIEHIKAQEITR